MNIAGRKPLMRAFLVGTMGLLGCAEAAMEPPPQPMGKPFHYAMDDTLRLQHVQVRGTHNSYHVDSNGGTFDPWAYTHAPIYDQLDRLGIRQLELDVYDQGDDGLQVFHVPGVDMASRCLQFADCLIEVRRFSDAFPGHLPIYIQIEPKNDFQPEELEPFFARLEGEITKVFAKSRIITPDEVQGQAATLREVITGTGWPALGQLRGRVFFAFDTTGPLRTAYTHDKRDLRGRLLFVDSAPSDPFAAISVMNDPDDPGQPDAIKATVAANLLVRSRADSDTDEARAGDTKRGMAALAVGVHFISTDFPEPTATIPYHFEVPGGTPARCNPLSAPMACSSLQLEDPAFVGTGAPGK